MAVEVAGTAVAIAVEVDRVKASLSARGPSIQTCLQEISSGAICILSGGKEVTFVPNPPHVLGKTSPVRSLQNEPVTSPAK